jgi:hypothetical protein
MGRKEVWDGKPEINGWSWLLRWLKWNWKMTRSGMRLQPVFYPVCDHVHTCISINNERSSLYMTDIARDADRTGYIHIIKIHHSFT